MHIIILIIIFDNHKIKNLFLTDFQIFTNGIVIVFKNNSIILKRGKNAVSY